MRVFLCQGITGLVKISGLPVRLSRADEARTVRIAFERTTLSSSMINRPADHAFDS